MTWIRPLSGNSFPSCLEYEVLESISDNLAGEPGAMDDQVVLRCHGDEGISAESGWQRK